MTEVNLETQDPISVDLESDIPTIDVDIDTSEYNFIIEMQASGPPGPPGPPGDFHVADLLGKTTLSDTNASTALATAAAIKSYVDGLLAANDAMIYIDAINASGNPKYPAASTGHTYKISAAGKIGGAQGPSVEIGDMIICISDNTVEGTHSEVGSKWNIIQTNIDGAVIGPSTATGNNFVVFDGDSGKLIKNSTYNANSFAEKTHNHVGTHTRKYSANLSANKTQTITHGLNTEDVIVMVRETGGNKSRIMTDVNITGTDTISIGFADTPTANAYRVTVIG